MGILKHKGPNMGCFVVFASKNTHTKRWGKSELTPVKSMWRNCERAKYLQMYQTKLTQNFRGWNHACIVEIYLLFVDVKMVIFAKIWKNCFFGVFFSLPRYRHLENYFLCCVMSFMMGLTFGENLEENGLLHVPQIYCEVCDSKKSQMCHCDTKFTVMSQTYL